MPLDSPLNRYTAMAVSSADRVISAYSTSFTLATRLLAPPVRADIRTLYAVVRIADEIVDGVGAAAGLHDAALKDMLRDFEAAVLAAPGRTLDVNPVLHAWGDMARRCEIDPAHVCAFFHSMNADVSVADHTAGSFDTYVYGSAEVIGLMCLQIFRGHSPELASREDREVLDDGARRLGAAFQKINFLRDLAEDSETLGRSYFPTTGRLTEADKQAAVDDIRADLAAADRAIAALPDSARVGVRAAAMLFAELTDRIERTPVATLYSQRTRVRVPAHVKALILARAVKKEAVRG